MKIRFSRPIRGTAGIVTAAAGTALAALIALGMLAVNGLLVGDILTRVFGRFLDR